MNILFLSSWYPTKTNPNFGVFVKEHAHAIETTGNDIVVLAIVIHRSTRIYSISLSDNIDEARVRTVLIELNTCFRDILYHAVPLQYYLVKSVFKKKIQPNFNPDIIHSNVVFPAGIIGHWLSKSLKKPHVITEHWTRIRHFMKTPIVSFWGKKAYESAARILPVSFYLQHEIMPYISNKHINKFRVIGNVIDSDIFFYEEKRQIKTELKLCSIATWTHLKDPAKQPELLIHALSELQKEINQTIILTMIGGGDKVPELKKLCADKLVKADFTGYLEKAEIAKRLQDSDFFVHPTKVETFGVVVAEALLTGTPVICSNVCALTELISQSNGILCENNVEDWIRGLKQAINTKFDHKQIAIKVKHKYDKINIGKAINSVYQELK
ncbi:MAG: glycosyltransferase [Bacteroidota bacterium]|nr:glycosyltransferase [Bacteroidota bacterium]